MPKVKLTADNVMPADLLTLEQLHKRLGRGYSPRTMRRKIANGEYIQGKHYFRTGGVNGIIKVYLKAVVQDLIEINC